jgi:hypothetical protein
MGAIGDVMALEDQEKLDQEAAAAAHAKEYNANGTLKADDYRPPTLAKSTFPAGIRFGGELRVNRDGLTAVAGSMNQELSGQLQPGLQDLNNGGGGGGTIGGWDTADGMGTNAGNAWYAISSAYQSLNAVYEEFVTSLRQTASNYADAEDATTTAARNVGSDAAPSGGLAA